MAQELVARANSRDEAHDRQPANSHPMGSSSQPLLQPQTTLPLVTSINAKPLPLSSTPRQSIPSGVPPSVSVDSGLPADAEDSHLVITHSNPSSNASFYPPQGQASIVSLPSPSSAEPPAHTSNTVEGVKGLDSVPAINVSSDARMLFGQYSGPGHRRGASGSSSASYDPELTTRDKTKQKMAVRRFLAQNVRSDWQWQWPLVDSSSSHDSPTTATRKQWHERWKERDEWESDIDNESDHIAKGLEAGARLRFEKGNEVGVTMKKSVLEHKRARQKRLKQDMAENEGFRCFVLRRDAWTGARKVRRSDVLSASSPKRQRTSNTTSSSSSLEISSPSPKSTPALDGNADLNDTSDWETDVEVPIPNPLLPPDNHLRQSVTPSAYGTIYDKVILTQLTPACPINLTDITRSCVQGWKRDGEWPAKASVPSDQPSAAAKKKSRKLSIASLFSLERLSPKENGEALAAAARERGRERGRDIESQREVEMGREKEIEGRKGSLGFLEAPVGPIKRGFNRLLSLGRESKSRRGSKESIENGKDSREVTDINLA